MAEQDIFAAINQAIPSLGLGQVESAQQVGVDDTLQRLIDLIMQPQEGPQAPEVRPAANTLSTIGDALAASAAGLTRNPGLRTQFVRDLQNRRAFEQQRLDQQSQRERQGQVQALGLQLGAEQEGLARTQRGKERAQAREDKIARQGREDRKIVGQEVLGTRQLLEEADLGAQGFDLNTAEGRSEARRVARRTIRKREMGAINLTDPQRNVLADANAIGNTQINGATSNGQPVTPDTPPEEVLVPTARMRLESGATVEQLLLEYEFELDEKPLTPAARQLALNRQRLLLEDIAEDVSAEQQTQETIGAATNQRGALPRFAPQAGAAAERVGSTPISSGMSPEIQERVRRGLQKIAEAERLSREGR